MARGHEIVMITRSLTILMVLRTSNINLILNGLAEMKTNNKATHHIRCSYGKLHLWRYIAVASFSAVSQCHNLTMRVVNDYRITGIIRGRKVSRIAFFAIVREKTFAIQVISLYKNSGRDRKCKKTFANASRFAKFAKLFFRG